MFKDNLLKIIITIIVSLAGPLLAIPSFLSESSYQQLAEIYPFPRISLGLDLQGGVSLLYQIDEEEVLTTNLEQLKVDTRTAFRSDRIRYSGLRVSNGELNVSIRNPDDLSKATQIVRRLTTDGIDLFSAVPTSPQREVIVDENKISVVISPTGRFELVSKALDQAVEVIRRRIDQLGTKEPLILRQGANRVLVQAPGLNNPDRLKSIVGTTAEMTWQLVDDAATSEQSTRARPNRRVVPSSVANDIQQTYVLFEDVIVRGSDLLDAQAVRDQASGQWVVSFRLSPNAARKFATASSEGIGRTMAVVLDNEVVSAPVLRNPILDGVGQIESPEYSFVAQAAEDFALLLRAGSLPASMIVVEEETVGPSLGADSVAAGKLAAQVAFLGVIIFMVIYYGQMGLISGLSVIINGSLIVTVLAITGATLTLPGIAGIILTIGMAVDANILIFERMREEFIASKNLRSAMQNGFQRALTTILDANLTTMIAAAVLFLIGTGAIKGFAVTLGIGILTTIFTAFSLTKFLVGLWFDLRKPSQLTY